MLKRSSKFLSDLEARYGRTIAVSLILASAIWVLVIHILVPVLPYDDAFITYRYAENIFAGEGPVYNQGERVFGSSTPLYLAWVTTIKFLGSEISLPELVVRLNAFWLITAGVLSYLLVRRLSSSRLLGALAAVIILLHRSMLAISTGGMESFLFVSLLLACWLALISERALLAGLLAGLAILTRPEGVVLIPLMVVALWHRRDRLVKAGIACSLVGLIWVVFATKYYGSPIPNSVIAKSQPLYPIPVGASAKAVLTGLPGMLIDDYELTRKPLAASLVWAVWMLAAIATVIDSEARRRLAWLPAGFVIGVLALYLVGNPALFLWYWPHLFVPAILALVVGLPVVGSRLSRRFGQQHPAIGKRAVPIAISLLILICSASLFRPYVGAPGGMLSTLTDVSENAERLRVLAYRKTAEELNQVTDDQTRLAAPEIGSLGYYFKGKLLDGCGLVSPEVIPFLPVPEEQRFNSMIGALSLELIQATEPEWIATMPIFANMSLFPSPWFQQNYEVVGRVPLPKEIWMSNEVTVLRRRSG